MHELMLRMAREWTGCCHWQRPSAQNIEIYMDSEPYNRPKFWPWFFLGVGSNKPGWRAFLDIWLLLHVGVGVWGIFLGGELSQQAQAIVFPFSAVLFGVTFAWSGNIAALLSTKEISTVSDHSAVKIQGYVFQVQRSVLVMLLSVILWCLAALVNDAAIYLKFLCYFFSSLAVRESWQVILFAQYLTIARKHAEDLFKSETARDKVK